MLKLEYDESMINIAKLNTSHVRPAIKVIAKGLFDYFKDADNISDFLKLLEERREFDDVINFVDFYNNNSGVFLVVFDNDQLIGTGALCRLDGEVAELRRLWLSKEYHGQGIGYSLVKKLLEFAIKNDYSKIRLQTNHIQVRAVSFYKRLGFYEIECYNNLTGDDLSMELDLHLKFKIFKSI